MYEPANKGNQLLGIIKRNFVSRNKELMRLCTTMLLSHLENCIQAWNPYFKKDRDLGRVQHRATKMITGCK